MQRKVSVEQVRELVRLLLHFLHRFSDVDGSPLDGELYLESDPGMR